MSRTGTGFEVSSSGGSFLGNSASRTFAANERYQGRARLSSSAFSISMGLEVSTSGGSFFGNSAASMPANSDFHRGTSSVPFGRSRSSWGSDELGFWCSVAIPKNRLSAPEPHSLKPHGLYHTG